LEDPIELIGRRAMSLLLPVSACQAFLAPGARATNLHGSGNTRPSSRGAWIRSVDLELRRGAGDFGNTMEAAKLKLQALIDVVMKFFDAFSSPPFVKV
jgi:hypothetical protein